MILQMCGCIGPAFLFRSTLQFYLFIVLFAFEGLELISRRNWKLSYKTDNSVNVRKFVNYYGFHRTRTFEKGGIVSGLKLFVTH
jgi:hypothetical protein